MSESLAALAMLKDKHFIKAASIIAIEEPEVHLHPSAIHQLIEVILGLSALAVRPLRRYRPGAIDAGFPGLGNVPKG